MGHLLWHLSISIIFIRIIPVVSQCLGQGGNAEVGVCGLRRQVPDVLLEEQCVPLIHCVLFGVNQPLKRMIT